MNKAMKKSGGLQLRHLYEYGVYAIFVCMIIVFSFTNKNFLTGKNALLILEQSSPLMLGVCGMAFVLMLGGIDISAGANMYLSAVVASLYKTFVFRAR